ncbi:MAG: type VI secretion system-associated protein TagF [Acidithiobacillus sp.]
MQGMAPVGFFGKLPSVGDFVQRRLPPGFVEVWDRSWEQAVSATRMSLGDQWGAAYYGSPLWRFVLPPGVCTESAWAGVLGPSVDRVGRCFPMVLAASLGMDAVSPIHLIQRGYSWFAALEQVFFHGQSAERGGVDAFDAHVTGLPDPLDTDVEHPWLTLHEINWHASEQWRIPLSGNHAVSCWLTEMWSRLTQSPGSWCLWWTMQGGGQLQPTALLTRGLPQTAIYAGFLDGACGSDVWSVPAGLSLHTNSPAMPTPSEMSITVLDDAVVGSGIPQCSRGSNEIFGSDDLPGAGTFESSQDSYGVAMVHMENCGLTLLVADEGLPDIHRQATNKVVDLVETRFSNEIEGGLSTLRTELLAMHQSLADCRDDLVNPVEEESAVIALRIRENVGELMRIGSAVAWQWRGGRVWALLHARGEESDQSMKRPVRGGMAGLGGDAEPDSAAHLCKVEPGDRFLMVATQSVIEQLSEGLIAQAFALSSCEAACAFIADALQLGGRSGQWPIKVIEVKG